MLLGDSYASRHAWWQWATGARPGIEEEDSGGSRQPKTGSRRRQCGGAQAGITKEAPRRGEEKEARPALDSSAVDMVRPRPETLTHTPYGLISRSASP